MVKILLKACTILSLWLALIGCGSSSPNTGLILLPVGPTEVALGETLQFTPTEGGLAFIVVGGDENGTIDGTGLYTAPDQLPANPDITIMGLLNGTETFSFVHLIEP